MTPVTTGLVFAGGEPPGLSAHDLPAATLRVAADSGADHAHRMQIPLDVVVGDFDSISDAGRAWAQTTGAEEFEFPSAKDATDLDLAIRLCVDRGIDRVIIVGGLGGRADHQMGNVMLLASPDFASQTMELRTASTCVQVVRSQPVELLATAGDTVSLVAAASPVSGLRTRGLQWELDDADLPIGSSWTLSNVAVTDAPTVVADAGVVLAFTVRTVRPAVAIQTAPPATP